ncbi:hypothetical protein SAICODRAFT_89161 [Saitoella complicata NRRL Y-17804]|uniref:uncharacterized protein n=1 Tax=Saitoella complicata (strain BCRC 22490 / CBS 7301 / JCM 7358 / NBRC 10748 / NRRL Y-17804) TaxID=698492 RepID=UPI000866B594|nr:uncharacterized protein SAICODRAFT_89161 [Saitoella complicata NRRL Y-17804]ODQ55018.1 hypothetical protein SAICODRAFT_89161 [Saitoella complicata NRRL Y-17804]
MRASSLTLTFALATLAAALPKAPVDPVCYNLTIPVTISAANLNLLIPEPANELVVIDLTNQLSSIASNLTDEIEGTFELEATYEIGATLCLPAGWTGGGTLQFLIHGILFDRTYWDLPTIDGVDYSYVDVATAAGYATFAIDRLGVGASSKPDPIRDVQLFAEIETVHQLTNMLRSGKLTSDLCSGPTLPDLNFDKIIHIGHSFGSLITNGLVSYYPTISDGIILTGYSVNATWLPMTTAGFLPTMATLDQPDRFSGLPNGYLLTNNIYNNQLCFFRAPEFDPAVLAYAEAHKQTFTIGELITLPTAFPPTPFTGPVFVVTGELDWIFCGGYCPDSAGTPYSSIPAGVQSVFPVTDSFETYLPPSTGHALNAHLTAPDTYEHMITWAEEHGF